MTNGRHVRLETDARDRPGGRPLDCIGLQVVADIALGSHQERQLGDLDQVIIGDT